MRQQQEGKPKSWRECSLLHSSACVSPWNRNTRMEWLASRQDAGARQSQLPVIWPQLAKLWPHWDLRAQGEMGPHAPWHFTSVLLFLAASVDSVAAVLHVSTFRIAESKHWRQLACYWGSRKENSSGPWGIFLVWLSPCPQPHSPGPLKSKDTAIRVSVGWRESGREENEGGLAGPDLFLRK